MGVSGTDVTAKLAAGEAAVANAPHSVFGVEYVDCDLIRRREPLTACWSERFERLSPVRKIRPYPGQRSITRDYWVATTRARLACESHLERHHAMLLDFDPQVVGLAGQPFRLFWPGRRGRQGHVPDIFVRRHDTSTIPAWPASPDAIPLHWRHRLLVLQTTNHSRDIPTDPEIYTNAAIYPDAITLAAAILNPGHSRIIKQTPSAESLDYRG